MPRDRDDETRHAIERVSRAGTLAILCCLRSRLDPRDLARIGEDLPAIIQREINRQRDSTPLCLLMEDLHA